MEALIAGIIAAAVGAVSGLFGSIQSDVEAYQNAEAQQAYINNEYLADSQKADEEFAAAKEQAERNAQQAEQQADLTDESLNIAEKSLGDDFNSTIDSLYLSQQADTQNWNLSAMQSGSASGGAYANLAGSGVRAGSSLSDAVLMESAVNASQLQFAQDSKRKSDSNNLGQVLSGLAGNRAGIEQNRIGADIQRGDAQYLRESYLEGGHNYNLYQLQKSKMLSNWAYNNYQLEKEKQQHSGWNAFWNGFLAMHGGGAKGFSTGYNVGKTVNESISYNTSLGDSGKKTT